MTAPQQIPEPALEVVRSEERGRYELLVGGVLGGVAEFRLRSGRIVFTHTEIAAEVEGRGLGSHLAREALGDAASRGEVIVPVCPFMAAYLRRHTLPDAVIDWPEP
ncbi:GNAT family N-acetyltransferase [Demequina iriomotensis]|uniref:GNAT family N-acetyltransferase n=1 Tax=Demequina iriomotensis TaxID=1536641 RepID=UPI0007839B32|nr:GNAT family N-acetyltransferase [Demequina iriomotensis]